MDIENIKSVLPDNREFLIFRNYIVMKIFFQIIFTNNSLKIKPEHLDVTKLDLYTYI